MKNERNFQIGTSVLVMLVYAILSSILGRRLVGRPMNRMSEKLIEIEEQLCHADRLASVGQLAAAMIHDAATPLNIISGRAMMIQERNVPCEKATDSARRIAEQSDRIKGMICRLLTFARKGQTQRERERTSLLELMSDVVMLVSPLAKSSQVRVRLAATARDVVVPANRGEMRQVMMNLVMNAIQAMPRGGAVTVDFGEDSAVRPNATQRVPCAFVCVRDQGVGIPEADRDRIFEPFYTTKGEKEGTGLGLSVSRAIVHAHGGWIAVDSNGEGTVFTAHLPSGGEI